MSLLCHKQKKYHIYTKIFITLLTSSKYFSHSRLHFLIYLNCFRISYIILIKHIYQFTTHHKRQTFSTILRTRKKIHPTSTVQLHTKLDKTPVLPEITHSR